ncbi:tetratricopeptide repeat protein [Sediminibacterium sp.]|uniref:tetratricopeptide repeat protein n=1 Tax=Sediminibacterium sp. TaxID=1917865 RepID=UPI0027264CB4|nr:tetratricopeptide repeat protein [Sediminibacterium sp.]MDO9000299.1 tetratricopeptide repeat protein [Bacteroidota bacterium]MDP3147132.1 tetratricopeptide repeat protein [Bacteroidota bacterium]MDP3567339.1 tetratricopeptide repeat protein [Sediminibacterium sp.]
MKHVRKFSALALFVFFSSTFLGQKTAIFTDKDALYKQGLDLFDKKQFVQSQKSFNEYYSVSNSKILKTDAIYYSAACAIELFNKDGEWQMKQFVENYPESNKINSANFYLGKSNFRKKKHKETIEFFEKVDIYKLDKEQLAELYFKRGYSNLEIGQDEKAKTDFYEIKDLDNKYMYPANYYYSHIAYKEKNYEIALKGFNKLVGNETFGSVVPYYITQIYFIQNKYSQVVKEAPLLLNDSANVQKEGEINRMIGESYFNLKDYNNALVYLKKTDLASGNSNGSYALGYCYYKINDCQNAVVNFEKVTVNKDSLAQNAWYHMADCYLKLSEKIKAKNAYYSAYQLNFDKKIIEDALFGFAKLSYELDFSPFNEAVKAFSKYLKEYPNSPRKEDCYNFLINVYSTTKNYDLAIKSIEALEQIDPILKVTYQKLIYFKGVEHFNNSDLKNAEKEFKKSLSQNSDLKLNALNQYWLGEISFIRKDYTTAIDIWKKFQIMDGATPLKEYDLSNYALGYAYFLRKEKDDFTNANISFRKFLLTKNTYDEKKITDAYIRVGDSYFMNRDFAQASDNYKIAIAQNKFDVDYCLYQKALCDGLSKNFTTKIDELKKIETRYPESNYLSAALNEIADTYYNNLKDQENAIVYYSRILKNYPNSSFTQNCNAQLGNIYYERKQDDKAFEYFDKFIKFDSKSDAAKEVLEIIKKIFTEKGKVDEMEKYFVALGNPLSENQIEKATYTAAYDAYYTLKDCDVAMQKWETYILKFPNGKNINEAQFSYSECAYSKNLFEKALPGYLYIIEKPRGLYTEASLTKASYLYYKDKKYQEALPLYLKMQELAESPVNKSLAKFGAMRCAFYLNQFETALTECTKVLNTEKLTPQQTTEAKYIKAKSLYETGRYDDAMIEFKAMTKASKNVTGAEAYYHIAKIQFAKKEYKEVEKTINKLISYEYSNDDWNNKGMLLLADAYIAKGDEADAQVILESLIDNKPKQEYIDEANKRLDSLKAKQEAKQAAENKMSYDDMKVQFNQSLKDSSIMQEIKFEAEGKTPTNNEMEIQQPK